MIELLVEHVSLFQNILLLDVVFRDKDIVINKEALILEAANSLNSEVESQAVITLCEVKKNRKAAMEVLVKKLNSDKWYIRGNAARSLGIMKIPDKKIIEKIELLLFDDEGNGDWNVEESAILALRDFGKKAEFTVPSLLKLLYSYRDEEDCSGYTCLKKEVCLTLGEVSSGTEEVISALIDVVEKQGWISTPGAIIALGKYGNKSLSAIPAIERFLRSEHFDSSDKTEELIWDALVNIEGDDSDLASYLLSLISKYSS